MKYCDCTAWKWIIGKWETSSDIYNSSKVDTPMYFGKEIYYCPWCGELLKKEGKGNKK